MSRLRGLLTLGLGAAVTACSLLVTLDDDALTDGVRGTGIDAAAEASVEASTDADRGSDGGGGFSCDVIDPRPTYCEDFDGDGGLTAWSVATDRGSATIVPDPGATSAPSVLLATTDTCPTDAMCFGTLTRELPVANELEAAFDIRIDQTTAGAVSFGSFKTKINQPNGGGTSYVNVRDGFWIIDHTILDPTGTDYSKSKDYDTNIPMVLGKWYRVTLRVVLTQPASVRLTIDGQSLDVPYPSDYHPAASTFRLGLFYVDGPTTPVRAVYDNVAITLK